VCSTLRFNEIYFFLFSSDVEDHRGVGRVGRRDRVGQPPVGPADRAALGQDAALLDRAQVSRSSPYHRLLRRLQVIQNLL
jgi:hypothetical protein